MSLQAKYKMLLHARMHRQFMSANGIEPCRSIPLRMGRIDFENNLKRSPKSEKALVPKLSPFTQLLLIRQRKPFSPSHSVCSFFFLPFLRLSFMMGPLSHFQQRTILKVYQQLLVNPFLLLCARFSGVPFLLPPPRGLLERRALSWPCGEKMAEFIPCCVGDNTPEHDTSRLRLQAADSFLAFSLSPLLQCRH